jgi:3D (Asp-Asp-Asp) domain-containing protein
MEPVTITDQHPVASIAIDPKVIAMGSPILEVDVTEVSNPSLVPIGIAVFISGYGLFAPSQDDLGQGRMQRNIWEYSVLTSSTRPLTKLRCTRS